mgnify:CR=1 FL=1
MIKHKNRIKQVIDFSGVGDSKIHPTDIDAVLEFDDKYLLLFEIWISFVSSTECLVNLICLAFLVHKVLPVAVSITPKGHLVFL